MAVPSEVFTPELARDPDANYMAELKVIARAQRSVTELDVVVLGLAAETYIDRQVGCPSPDGRWSRLNADERKIAGDCVLTGNHMSPDARAKYITKLRRLDSSWRIAVIRE